MTAGNRPALKFQDFIEKKNLFPIKFGNPTELKSLHREIPEDFIGCSRLETDFQ